MSIVPRSVSHAVQLARPDVEPRDLGPGHERHASGGRPAEQRADRAQRLADPVDRHAIGAEELAGIQERQQLQGLLRRDQAGAGHAPRLGHPELAPVVGPALLRASELDRPHRVEARRAVKVQRREELDRLEGEAGHRPRIARGEEAARRMGRRAAGRRDRPLVHHHDVGPAQPGEVVCGARADDPGTHDDERGGARDGHRIVVVAGRTHQWLPPRVDARRCPPMVAPPATVWVAARDGPFVDIRKGAP